MVRNLDGSIVYQGSELTDVLLFGVSVQNLAPVEVKRYVNGMGYVVTRRRYGDPTHVLKDYHDKLWDDTGDVTGFYYADNPNIPNTFFYTGQIEVTLA